ncbi:MAG: ShlB/FhaC/HecB family hemolysin secretion/activation protein, partial [Gammaproteobacteria bacterium]
DRVVTPVLKAGAAPGTVDLTLRVEDHLPFHGSVELNNQYTTDTSHLRALGSLSYSNLFQRFDSISLQYQRAPQELSEVDVLVASYMARVGSWRWALSYLHSASEVASVAPSAGTSGSPNSLLVIGKGSVYGAHFILPLPGSSSLTHSFTLGADYKDFLEAINAQATDPTKAVDLTTPISYLNLSMGYGGFWRGVVHQASLDTSVNFGVRGLGNSELEFESKRFRGRPNYFYLRSALTFGSHLPHDFTLLTRLAGQYAVEPVVSNEQFSIAGADGVRGYLEAEELADTGVKAGVQLGTPQWALFGGSFRADAFTFYDIGRIGVVDSLPGEPSNISLRSWGAGLNLSAFDHITGTLTWAYPLADGSVTFSGDSMLLFSVRSWW